MQLTHAADMHVPAALTDYSGLNHSICLPGRAGLGLFPKPWRNHIMQYSNWSTGGDRVQALPDCVRWLIKESIFWSSRCYLFFFFLDRMTFLHTVLSFSSCFCEHRTHVSFFFGAEISFKPGKMNKPLLGPLSLRPSQICHLIQSCLCALEAVPEPS